MERARRSASSNDLTAVREAGDTARQLKDLDYDDKHPDEIPDPEFRPVAQ